MTMQSQQVSNTIQNPAMAARAILALRKQKRALAFARKALQFEAADPFSMRDADALLKKLNAGDLSVSELSYWADAGEQFTNRGFI
jgi:hypothetical protein